MTWLEEYGTAVLNGKIVACDKIKRIYNHLLEKMVSKSDRYIFSEKIANDHINFIETFCKQAQGKMGAPLKLELFQKAKFQAVFGFVDAETELRQYNECLTIEGRKNGKTTECAALELDLLVNDREGSPEIYNIATKRDQARKGFNEAWKMIIQSPDLRKHIRKRQHDLYFPLNMGTITALASNVNSLDGLNSHVVILDELEAIKNRDVYDQMKQSMSSRDQPLFFCISTNGFIRDGIFDAQYRYAEQVLIDPSIDPHFLPIIYELDDPDEWDKEDMWIKANPGLGKIKKLSFLRGSVEKAKRDPEFKPTVMVKDFDLKESPAQSWLRWKELDNEQCFDIDFDYCIGSFDAADSVDLNAAKAVCMRPGDNHIYVRSMYWIPEKVLEDQDLAGDRKGRDNVPYKHWVKCGYMRTYPGNKVMKQVFLDWFIELRDEFDLYPLYIYYDPWHIDDSLKIKFEQEFGAKTLVPVSQGTRSLSEPMKDLKADFRARKIIYNNNPVDKFCLVNVVAKQDINGNIQPVKMLDPRKRIDGAVTLIMAYKGLQDKRDEYVNLNKSAEGGD